MFTMAEIGERLQTQDNRITSEPMYLVQQETRLYVLADDCADGTEIIDGEEVRYRNIWEYVNCFLTEAAAEQFLLRRGHDYRKLRVYVDSGCHNPEWIAVRAHLAKLGAGST